MGYKVLQAASVKSSMTAGAELERAVVAARSGMLGRTVMLYSTALERLRDGRPTQVGDQEAIGIVISEWSRLDRRSRAFWVGENSQRFSKAVTRWLGRLDDYECTRLRAKPDQILPHVRGGLRVEQVHSVGGRPDDCVPFHFSTEDEFEGMNPEAARQMEIAYNEAFIAAEEEPGSQWHRFAWERFEQIMALFNDHECCETESSAVALSM